MTSRKRTMGTRVAIVAALMISVCTTGAAVAQQRPKMPRFHHYMPSYHYIPYTPAAGAKDLKSVLFNWAWYMGMLRSDHERDLIMTLDYKGKGTMQVDGQPCNVSLYRADISYRASGERVRITGTRPNGQSCSNIQVLSGGYAWNSDILGAGLVPGRGHATPMPATVAARMIRLWASPQGAWKAAMAGTEYPNPPHLAPRPQYVPAGKMKVSRTSVKWEGDKPVLTFPIPGVPNATATATLSSIKSAPNKRFMPERVVVKDGADTYEFTYSNYKDWNNPLNPVEAFYAGRMTEKKNGTVVSDIRMTRTAAGQMYVVMPVPASVKAAMKPTHQPLDWTLEATPPPGKDATVATPRRADGHPDLSGIWSRPFNPITGNGRRRCGPSQVKGQGIDPSVGCRVPMDNFWVDYEWISPSRFGVWGLPTYKPQYWDKIQHLDQYTDKDDPVMTCKPLGLPRHGTPRRIVQTDKDMIFFYPENADYGGGNNEYRDVPTDGRKRPTTGPAASLATFYGLGIGTWHGDTLEIVSTNFDDSTWLGRGGFIHSASMRIVEKFKRVGNTLRYDMTIYDPEMFVHPWVMKTRVLHLMHGDKIQPERRYCHVYTTGNITSLVRH